jgi:hypothetical protein
MSNSLTLRCICFALMIGLSSNVNADVVNFTNPNSVNESQQPANGQTDSKTKFAFNSHVEHVEKTLAFNPPQTEIISPAPKTTWANPVRNNAQPTSTRSLGSGSHITVGSRSQTLPEPGSALLFVGGLTMWTLRRRRS